MFKLLYTVLLLPIISVNSQCSTPPNVTNALVTSSGPYISGVDATYACCLHCTVQGGNLAVKCLPGDNWQTSVPDCKPDAGYTACDCSTTNVVVTTTAAATTAVTLSTHPPVTQIIQLYETLTSESTLPPWLFAILSLLGLLLLLILLGCLLFWCCWCRCCPCYNRQRYQRYFGDETHDKEEEKPVIYDNEYHYDGERDLWVHPHNGLMFFHRPTLSLNSEPSITSKKKPTQSGSPVTAKSYKKMATNPQPFILINNNLEQKPIENRKRKNPIMYTEPYGADLYDGSNPTSTRDIIIVPTTTGDYRDIHVNNEPVYGRNYIMDNTYNGGYTNPSSISANTPPQKKVVVIQNEQNYPPQVENPVQHKHVVVNQPPTIIVVNNDQPLLPGTPQVVHQEKPKHANPQIIVVDPYKKRHRTSSLPDVKKWLAEVHEKEKKQLQVPVRQRKRSTSFSSGIRPKIPSQRVSGSPIELTDYEAFDRISERDTSQRREKHGIQDALSRALGLNRLKSYAKTHNGPKKGWAET